MTNPLKRIALVAHLAGEQNSHKRAYLSRLDQSLQDRGYCLLLIDQGGHEIEGDFLTRQFDPKSDRARLIQAHLHAQLKQCDLFQQAVAVEAGFLSCTKEGAADKLFSTASAIMAILEEETIHAGLIWHQFNGVSMLLAWHLRDHRIPFQYVHLGPIPGAIVFEPDGQMAESWIVRESKRFLNLPVNNSDEDKAFQYLTFVRKNFLDRKAQPDSLGVKELASKNQSSGRPVIFYAGQNDFRTGMTPRLLPHAKWHSPHYESTLDALQHLCYMAQKKKWTVLFKPHPNLRLDKQCSLDVCGEHIIFLPEANLFDCILNSDVTVTILSATAYQSLIHGRPTVLFGRMPLTGKKCCYEVHFKPFAAHTLSKALKRGFTLQQQEYWRRHIAQIIKYYAFSFDSDIETIIGKGPDTATQYLVSYFQDYLPKY